MPHLTESHAKTIMTAITRLKLTHAMHWATGTVTLGLLTACALPPTQPTVEPLKAPWTEPYKGMFTAAGCGELDNGLYYADAVEVSPRTERVVNADYIKVFFSSPDCSVKSQLIIFHLPRSEWEIVGQTLIDGKNVDQVIVRLMAGKMKGHISNPDKVKESDTTYTIIYGSENEELVLQKVATGAVDKELRLIENDRLFFSDIESQSSPDDFPTALLPVDEAFHKQ